MFKQTVPPNRAPPIGWYLTVRRQDGSSERTAISWLPTRYRHGIGESPKLTLSASGFDPVTGTDRSALEQSQAAHAARDIYTRILALQGAGGALATKARPRGAWQRRRRLRGPMKVRRFPLMEFWARQAGSMEQQSPTNGHVARTGRSCGRANRETVVAFPDA